jgi:hypothetical protein
LHLFLRKENLVLEQHAHPSAVGAGPGSNHCGQPAGAAAAEAALAELRRVHLIYAWQATGNDFEVTVGRGTISIDPLGAAGVLRLAVALRRDRVTGLGRGYPAGHRTTRYELSDGRFADRHESCLGRYLNEYPYTVYLPGGDPSGCATVDFAARTKAEALALAGLARARGECTRCGSDRPLDVRSWQPDPAVPCPGCGTSATTPAVLHCRSCRKPIMRNPWPRGWPYCDAWLHTATATPVCRARSGVYRRRLGQPLARP